MSKGIFMAAARESQAVAETISSLATPTPDAVAAQRQTDGLRSC